MTVSAFAGVYRRAFPSLFERLKMDTILAAVDMAGVATFVGTVGVLIVGVAMAFKGITLAKRAVNKA